MTKHSEAPDWSYDDTKKKLLAIPEYNVRAFAIFLYIGGLRINEGWSFQPKNITHLNTKKGIRVIFRVRNEKNPKKMMKDMPLNPLLEKEYYDAIIGVVAGYGIEEFPFHYYCERTYRRRFRKYLDIHPHALRHLRVHHIDDKSVPGMESLTPRQYQDYFGWETIATSSQYQSRTRTLDLSELF